MKTPLSDRIAHAWSLLRNREPTEPMDYGPSVTYRPSASSFLYYNSTGSITAPLFNRIAVDVASLDFKHVKLDKDNQFKEVVQSSLNDILNTEANIDQTGKQFLQDAVQSLLDEGVVALVPTETDTNLDTANGGAFTIHAIRVGKIVEWFPKHVRVHLYNEDTGQYEDVVVEKRQTAILENPFYTIMNEPNSTLKRLVRKLELLDVVDEQSSSGKLDIIIQLPYTIKTPAKRTQADSRKQQIEDQMRNSKYGVAYIDAAEKITQLNRPVENNLMSQVEYLTSMFYNQLGLTKGIFDGTASPEEILNYYNRSIEPLAQMVVDELRRKFLTKTARTQKQSVDFFRDVFKLTPVKDLAELADKFTRNEILSSNEFRGIIGFKPHPDPKADELRNKNLNAKDQVPASSEEIKMEEEGDYFEEGVS